MLNIYHLGKAMAIYLPISLTNMFITLVYLLPDESQKSKIKLRVAQNVFSISSCGSAADKQCCVMLPRFWLFWTTFTIRNFSKIPLKRGLSTWMCHRLLEANGFSYLNIHMNFGHGILFVASWRYYISPDGLDKQHPCLWLAALGLD